MKTDVPVDLLAFQNVLHGQDAHALTNPAKSHVAAPVLVDQVPAWIWNLFMDELSKLFTLRLDGTPPEDGLEGTAMTWIETCCVGRRFKEHRDRPRYEAAFLHLRRTLERWPSPAMLIKALPEYREPPPPPPKSTVAERDAAAAVGFAVIREGLAYQDWLQAHQNRKHSAFDLRWERMRIAMKNAGDPDFWRFLEDPDLHKV